MSFNSIDERTDFINKCTQIVYFADCANAVLQDPIEDLYEAAEENIVLTKSFFKKLAVKTEIALDYINKIRLEVLLNDGESTDDSVESFISSAWEIMAYRKTAAARERAKEAISNLPKEEQSKERENIKKASALPDLEALAEFDRIILKAEDRATRQRAKKDP